MADSLQNLQTRDAFDEVNKAEGMGTGNKVHIRMQMRNRRKCILTIQGLDDDLDLKKISFQHIQGLGLTIITLGEF